MSALAPVETPRIDTATPPPFSAGDYTLLTETLSLAIHTLHREDRQRQLRYLSRRLPTTLVTMTTTKDPSVFL